MLRLVDYTADVMLIDHFYTMSYSPLNELSMYTVLGQNLWFVLRIFSMYSVYFPAVAVVYFVSNH